MHGCLERGSGSREEEQEPCAARRPENRRDCASGPAAGHRFAGFRQLFSRFQGADSISSRQGVLAGAYWNRSHQTWRTIMNSASATFLLWAPRLAGLLVAAFLGLFALDAFDGRSLAAAAPAFAIHLIPSLLVLAAVAVGWKLQWVGAIAFVGLAVLYAVRVGRLDWIAVISGPLLVVGLLFLTGWLRR
jgi:hypothetical protein